MSTEAQQEESKKTEADQLSDMIHDFEMKNGKIDDLYVQMDNIKRMVYSYLSILTRNYPSAIHHC